MELVGNGNIVRPSVSSNFYGYLKFLSESFFGEHGYIVVHDSFNKYIYKTMKCQFLGRENFGFVMTAMISVYELQVARAAFSIVQHRLLENFRFKSCHADELSFAKLRAFLEKSPCLVAGYFGRDFQKASIKQSLVFPSDQTTGAKINFTFFEKDSFKCDNPAVGHVVVVIGINITPTGQEMIYYIDPVDFNDRAENLPIYGMTYESFIERLKMLRTVASIHFLDREEITAQETGILPPPRSAQAIARQLDVGAAIFMTALCSLLVAIFSQIE